MKKSQIALLLSVLLCLGLYFMVPSIHVHLNHAVRVLGSLNLESVILYLREFGTYAALISFLLMILQSIIAPIPAFLITLSNAAIFGWV